MKTELYWKFIAFILTIMLPQDGSGEKVLKIPSDKAKVRYHRLRVCLTIKGESHCTYKNKASGNPHEIAAMFKHLKSVKYLSADGVSNNGKTMMMPGKVAAKPKTKPKVKLGNYNSEALFEQLQALISDQKYKEAVDLAKNLHNINKTIIQKVYAQQLIKGNGDKLMTFVYKLVQNNEKAIIKDCFPSSFQWFFNGDSVRLQNKARNGTLWVRELTSAYTNQRWLSTECEPRDGNGLFKFYPIWDTRLNSVKFRIINPAYEMELVIARYKMGKLAQSLMHVYKQDYWSSVCEWRIKPMVNDKGELALCFIDILDESYISQSECGCYVTAVYEPCTPDMGWIMDKP